MKKIITLLLGILFLVPSVSYASALTAPQVSSIIGLLAAFGVDQATIDIVYKQLVFSPAVSTITNNPTFIPSFGNIMAKPAPAVTQGTSAPTQAAPAPVDLSGISVAVVNQAPASIANDLPFGSFSLKVIVLDFNGKNTNKAVVTMTSPNNLLGVTREKTVDTTTDLHSEDYYTTFEYIPTKKGAVTLTFASGNLVKTFDLLVQ